MKHMAKKGKIALKSGGLGAKSGQFGVEKNTGWQQTRKAKWCKMQLTFLKTDKAKGMKE